MSFLQHQRVLLIGNLGGLSARHSQQCVREHGGTPVKEAAEADVVVLGADVSPLQAEQWLDEASRDRIAHGELTVLSETQLWHELGLVDAEASVRRLYTPAMLADLLQIPVAVVRRWHRRGLIVPAREVHRLPYFDFQEVATARQLAQLLAAGMSPQAIERRLAELAPLLPNTERPLAQLSIILAGRRILLRDGEGLIGAGGQRYIDFEAIDRQAAETAAEPAASHAEATLAMPAPAPASPAELLRLAADLEDEGHLDEAIEAYRAALAAGGPQPGVCFQLAEALYRAGDLTAARERYFMAIELDENYVEARANLGCVLAELGQKEWAAAAFQGALAHYPEYADAHYHLARTLDDLGRADEAAGHWQAFLEQSPDSPWAEEARERLEIVAR